ncbi:hypothetical protein TWF718_000220 [Orbilia javanica]|uniref:Nephrocystin 3-like N-terminal domain-containing protein n=1 Tax=Orbilia javanica TaxID=47235 RepID=A0AAN8NAX2_9PEZI
MADPLSITANILAIIQAVNTCWKLYSDAKGAKSDIAKLTVEVDSIKRVVEQVRKLIKDPKYADSISESQELLDALKGCNKELQLLQDKLDGQKGKDQKRFGFFGRTKDLKWPFIKSGVVEIVDNLERWKSCIDLLLTVYQADAVRKVDQKIDLAGIPVAEGAAYGSFADRHEPECLPGTRIELRKRIADWAGAPRGGGECIFWLSGAAGTGKSTISRTTAKEFKEKGQLAASFFFRRGEKDRGGAARLFTTLASQLANNIADVRRCVQKAIEADPSIPKMNIGEQFNKLILEPLSELRDSGAQSQYSRILIVIDALDECDHEKDQQLIVTLLSQLSGIKHIDIRVFLTSRPELPIRIGFKSLCEGIHQNVILHEVAGTDRDIGILLNTEFSNIQESRSLPPDWPGAEVIQKLVQIAVPLFIFAATVCRFIADENWDPQEQVKLVMKYQTDLNEDMDVEKTYLPILRRLVENQNSISQRERLAMEFRTIVGAIVNLASPLSIPSLARFVSIPEGTIDLRLKKLHSVLDVPPERKRRSPVRTFHLSFRDFLVSQSLHDHTDLSQFWIDEKETHKVLAIRCIELMSDSGGLGLKQDICSLGFSGILRSEIDEGMIQEHICPELQYACRYWVYHRTRSGDRIKDGDKTHEFVKRCLLWWLEAESLLGEMENTIAMISDLKEMVDADQGGELLALLYDVKRFLLRNRYIIGKAPLQTYISAIIFLPEESLIRKFFEPKRMVPWVRQFPNVEKRWDFLLQTLEGHLDSVRAVASFGGIVASASGSTIKLWNINTGSLLRTMEGCGSAVSGLAFSFDGTLASSSKSTIKTWNTDSGELLQTLESVSQSEIYSMSFSPDGVLAAGAKDGILEVWDSGGMLRRRSKNQDMHVSCVAVAFFQDTLAASRREKIELWDANGALLRTLVGHRDTVKSIAFSSDGVLASGSSDSTVKLWDVSDGTLRRTFQGHVTGVTYVGFSKDMVVSWSWNGTINLWGADGALLQTLEEPSFEDVAIGSEGILVAGCGDRTVRLWDLKDLALRMHMPEDTRLKSTEGVTFFSDGKALASVSRGGAIRFWSEGGELLNTVKRYTGNGIRTAFSADGILAVTPTFGEAIDLRNPAGELLQTLRYRYRYPGDPDLDFDFAFDLSTQITNLSFSSDGKLLAVAHSDGWIRVWGVGGELLQELRSGFESVLLALSSDARILASLSTFGELGLWDLNTGTRLPTPQNRLSAPRILALSPDNKILIYGSHTGTVSLWDPGAGEMLHISEGPEGTLEFASSVDAARLWDAHTLMLLRTFAIQRLPKFSKPSCLTESINDPSNRTYQPSDRDFITLTGEWLGRGQDYIWLPPNYRMDLTDGLGLRPWDIRDNRVALGHADGRVSLFEFQP